MDYYSRLATEAIVVGAVCAPVFVFFDRRVDNQLYAFFLAGVSVHLIAEASGLNAIYLKNAAASMYKAHEIYTEAVKTTSRQGTHKIL